MKILLAMGLYLLYGIVMSTFVVVDERGKGPRGLEFAVISALWPLALFYATRRTLRDGPSPPNDITIAVDRSLKREAERGLREYLNSPRGRSALRAAIVGEKRSGE